MSCCNCCKSNVRVVVLLGAPGAGKGTVAGQLITIYRMIHFSTGNLLRNEVENSTEMGQKIAAILKSGALVGDDVVNGVVESNLFKNSAGDVVLLDGYPRSVGQAKFLDSLDDGRRRDLVRVVEIDVDESVAVARISGRRVCEKCAATFGAFDDLKVCPDCGGALVRRNDDSEEIVKHRLQEYRRLTLPLGEYYADRLSKVSGNAAPSAVVDVVCGVLDGFGLERR